MRIMLLGFPRLPAFIIVNLEVNKSGLSQRWAFITMRPYTNLPTCKFNFSDCHKNFHISKCTQYDLLMQELNYMIYDIRASHSCFILLLCKKSCNPFGLARLVM
jgi:hypothetical protein